MKPIVLRHLIIGLLILTGIFHLAVALLNMAPGLAAPLTLFGVIYTGLSFYVRQDSRRKTKRLQKKEKTSGRVAIIVTMIACATGLGLGGSNYLQNGGPLALPIMFLIDIVIIAAGAMWLYKVHAKQ